MSQNLTITVEDIAQVPAAAAAAGRSVPFSPLVDALLHATPHQDASARSEMRALAALWAALGEGAFSEAQLADPTQTLERLIERNARAEAEGREAELVGLLVGHGFGLEVLQARLEALSRRSAAISVPDSRALVRYGYGMGSALGVVLCRIAGIESRAALHCVVDAGIALEVIGVATETLSGSQSGACLLPADSMERYGVTGDDVIHGSCDPSILWRLCQDVASLGLRYASSADEGLGALPLSARGPALLMLEEARGDALTLIGASAGPRTGVPREGWGRAGALRRAKALAKLAMPRYWPKNRPAHQRGLHAALRGLPGVSIYG